jgi:integrase
MVSLSMNETFSLLPQADISHIQRKWLDIPYAKLSNSQTLDIYLPDEGDGPFSVILHIHGGAFAIGDKRDMPVTAYLRGLERGYAVVSVNYRLSGEAIFPAGLQDLKAAIRWQRANQEYYHLDGSKIAACDKTFYGLRDKAVLLGLLDSGSRAKEFLEIKLYDYNQFSGEILIRHGKGGKSRTIFFGKITRRAVRAYLNSRIDSSDSLWVIGSGEQLTYFGLREVIRRRAKKAKIKTPSIHSFRRAFAINMLRAGVDVFSLQKLMGHADLQVLRRYLAQTTEDIAQAHRIGSPVDNNWL